MGLAKKNLEKSLQRVFFFSKLLLVFPLKQETSVKAVWFHRSVWFSTLSFAQIILMFFYTYYKIFINPIDNLTDKPVVALLVKCQFAIMLIHLALSVGYRLAAVGRLNDAIDDLMYIDILLSDYVTTLDNKDSLKGTLCFIVIQLLFYIADLLTFQNDIGAKLLFYWLSIVTHVLICQFAGIMDLFLSRFDVLLTRIEMLKNRKHPSPKVAVRLSNVHRLLSGAVCKTNKLFSLQLLAYTASSFFNLVSNTYCLFFILSQEFHIRNIMAIVIISSWLVMPFLTFYNTITRTHNVSKKAKEFNTLLFQLMMVDPTNNISNDKRLRLHISLKEEIIMTACGFFNLDSTLIHTMVAATTTYFVFLVQFGNRTAS